MEWGFNKGRKMIRSLLAACLGAACAVAGAAGNDDLWEVSTQMNMPGLPAGMGAQTSQVCAEKGDLKKAAQGRGAEKCTMKNFKQSGNSVHMEMSCPDGDAVIDNTYNAGRTEYKGTVKMSSRQGEMTMNMSGRRIGSCDAQEAKAEREAKTAAVRRQMGEARGQMAAFNAHQASECRAAVDNMQAVRLGLYGQCSTQKASCDSMLGDESTKEVASTCMASASEYCTRYKTLDGFLKANGDEQGARMCNVSRNEIASSHCPRALQTENLAYLGRFCIAESKPLAQQHCAGRGFTARVRDKYTDFCSAYLSQASLEEPAAPPAARSGIDPKQAVTEGVTQGINKLRGLFGR